MYSKNFCDCSEFTGSIKLIMRTYTILQFHLINCLFYFEISPISWSLIYDIIFLSLLRFYEIQNNIMVQSFITPTCLRPFIKRKSKFRHNNWTCVCVCVCACVCVRVCVYGLVRVSVCVWEREWSEWKKGERENVIKVAKLKCN